MRSALAAGLKQGLLHAGHYARRLRGQRFPGVAVLSYHGVRPAGAGSDEIPFAPLHVGARALDAHCRLVTATCHPIGLDRWRAAQAGDRALPPRPVLFTFDDGYRTVFTLARPILERHGIPAVCFVSSEPVRRQQLFWWDAAARRHGERHVEEMKALRSAEWRARVSSSPAAAGSGDLAAPLTAEEVGALARGVFEIGGHGASHAILARAPVEEQREEIDGNRAMLERWTGRAVRAFAYPNGCPGRDYTAETVALLGERGFDFAFTTRPGFATPAEPALERSRFVMMGDVTAAELAHRLAYSWRR